MVLLRLLAVATILLAAAPVCPADFDPQANLQAFDVVWNTLNDNYYDADMGGLDWEGIRDELRPKVAQAASMEEVRSLLGGMLSRFGQSHFGIIPEGVMSALGEGGGGPGSGESGIDIRIVEGRALVRSVAKDSPAAGAGVSPGWLLLSVGDEDVGHVVETLEAQFGDNPGAQAIISGAVMEKLQGKQGAPLKATFLDGTDTKRTVEMTLAEPRGDIFDFGHLKGIRVWSESRKLDNGIGYIAFNYFMHPVKVMKMFNEAMSSYLDADGIIIDLRGNGGGMLGMGMGMAGWFFEKEDLYLGTMKLRQTELKAIVLPRAQTYTGRVAVLVDGLSASMSEIFAGGLQDLGRARIFGTRTAGMALPSQIIRLPNGDGLQYVSASYTSAGGQELEGSGVLPDTETPLSRKALLAGKDPALDAALQWLKKEAAKKTER